MVKCLCCTVEEQKNLGLNLVHITKDGKHKINLRRDVYE